MSDVLTEQFIKKAKEIHRDRYDYSKCVYTKEKGKVKVICKKHGEFEREARYMLTNTMACDKCSKDMILNNYMEKANSKFGDMFDYSKFEYINAKTKSIVICKKHGEFEQNMDKNINSVYGCEMCANEQRKLNSDTMSPEKRKLVNEQRLADTSRFLKKAKEKFGEKFEYDLTNYSGMMGNNINIKCDKHGWFSKQPHIFMISGFGCTECGYENKNKSKTKTYDEFVSEATEIFDSKYVYPESNREIFKNRKSWIDIECKEHGMFRKQAQKHLVGQGCQECKKRELIENGSLPGGYNENIFKNNRELADKQAFIYYINVDNGKYYKIGININLENRLNALKTKLKASSIELILALEGSLEELYYKEQEILNEFWYYRKFTKKSTELFYEDIFEDKKFLEILVGCMK